MSAARPPAPTPARPAARAAVLFLLATGLGTLLLSDVRSLPPLRPALAVARKFWSANTPTRLANTPPFRARPSFTRRLFEADAAIPLSLDVVLAAGPDVAPAEAEESRRLAAYVLAPRRVLVSASPAPGLAFSAAAAGGPPR